MAKWVVVCFLPGDHPDRLHAEDAARLLHGGDVMLVQSMASWMESTADYQSLVRDRRRREAVDDEE